MSAAREILDQSIEPWPEAVCDVSTGNTVGPGSTGSFRVAHAVPGRLEVASFKERRHQAADRMSVS